MFEVKVLAAFLHDRKDYDHAAPHLDRTRWSPIGLAILELIDSYYANDTTAEKIDLDILRTSIDRRFKDVPKHAEKAHDLLVEVLNTSTSTANAVSEILSNKLAVLGTHLADALLSQDKARIQMYMQEYAELADTTVLEGQNTEEYIGTSIEDLAQRFDDSGTWNLAPASLGKRIKGGLRSGHHVVVAGRPERGKTLFGINFTAAFLQQGARVLYIGNEDPVPDLIIRLICNLTGMTEEEAFANPEKAMRLARKRFYDNCVFVGLAPGTLYEIEAMVRRHSPDIVVVDQMRNVRTDSENNTQRLEQVAQELRNIGRRHNCLMISMTQVGDSGRNKLELNDGDIDGSNTGIPGACDVIVMIGSNDDWELRDLRRLTLAKNKRGGDHGSITVHVHRPTSRVQSYEEL